jgi:hypothetical protein
MQNNGGFEPAEARIGDPRLGRRVIEDHRAAGGSYNADALGDLRCIVAIKSIKIVARLPLLNATAYQQGHPQRPRHAQRNVHVAFRQLFRPSTTTPRPDVPEITRRDLGPPK